jgi:hypothetical protein
VKWGKDERKIEDNWQKDESFFHFWTTRVSSLINEIKENDVLGRYSSWYIFCYLLAFHHFFLQLINRL